MMAAARRRSRPKTRSVARDVISGSSVPRSMTSSRGAAVVETSRSRALDPPKERRRSLPFAMANHLARHCAGVDTREIFFQPAFQQTEMRDVAEIFGDEPDWFFRRHPVDPIEPREIYRSRIAPEGAFAAETEVDGEIAQGQLAQRPVNRLAITAAGEIGFRDRAPMPARFENGDDVVGVLVRSQSKQE